MRINNNIDLTELENVYNKENLNYIYFEDNKAYYGSLNFIFIINIFDLFYYVEPDKEKFENVINGRMIPIDVFKFLEHKHFTIVQINEAYYIKCGVNLFYLKSFIDTNEKKVLSLIKKAYERETKEDLTEKQNYMCISKMKVFDIFRYDLIFLINKKNCIEARIITDDLIDPIKTIQIKKIYMVENDRMKERLYK